MKTSENAELNSRADTCKRRKKEEREIYQNIKPSNHIDEQEKGGA